MNRMSALLFTTLIISANTLGGSGTVVHTSSSKGMISQQSETHPEPNPLPGTESRIEAEKSKPIPNTNIFESYTRWIGSDGAAIAQDVALNSSGTNPFVGWNLNSERVSFHNNSSNVPLWEFVSDPEVYRNHVALSADANIVANASHRNLYLFNKNTGTITLNFPVPDNRIAGPVAVSRNGSLLIFVATSPLSGGTHRVYAFSPPSTVPIWTYDFSDAQSTGVYGITISRDNSTVGVNGKFHAWVFSALTGALKTDFGIDNTEGRLAFSADASVMAIAELTGFIKAFVWNPAQSQYDLIWRYKVPAGAFTNWASSVDVSGDGLTVMAGSLIFLGADYDGTIYMFDTFGEGLPNWVHTGVGDMVDEVVLSDDGSFAAAVTWGDLAHTKPDILIFERNSNTPIYTINTPGSMFSLAMSADGKTVVAGGKAVHARQFGNGGLVYNIEVDLGGGGISGTVTLTGAPSNAGATVEVIGTTRKTTTAANGSYVVTGVPAGSRSVRISKLGYVSQTISGITVVTGDTTENVNATLVQTGDPPTNLVASHSLPSRIQLSWTLPTSPEQRAYERLLATDDYPVQGSISARGTNTLPDIQLLPLSPPSSIVPPDSVRIYRAIRSGGPYYHKWTRGGNVSTFSDSTALPLTDYYYRVTAVYGNGESVYSNEAYGTVDSSFLQFNITAPHLATVPTIDGTMSPGEWTDALRVDVSDVFGNGGGIRLPRGSVFMYFKYDSVARRLYIAGEDFLNTDGLANSEGFGLYFDDNHNGQFEAPNTNPLLREGNYWAYYFTTGSTVRFREIYTTGGVNAVVDTVTDAQTAFSSASGRVVGEVSIPISFFHKNHLQVYGPDKVVGAGLFMISRIGGAAVFHGWWPQTMTSVFSPSGFGDIRIPLTLLAPPRAPSNVAVARQGQHLQVTWTDPTQGINGDPMTIPVMLELSKNGTVIRQFPLGVQSFLDTSVVAQGWYEYKLRGYIDVTSAENTIYYGPYSETVGAFAVSDPQLTQLIYDDGLPEVFYVVDFTYNDNKFGIRFTPQQYPARVYRVKAFTNNGNSPINVSIHNDSSGLPGALKAGPYLAESRQISGIDSLIFTIPADQPPTVFSGDFWVVLSYLPTSPGAPGIGGDFSPPIDQRSMYYTTSSGWITMTNADLIVRAYVTGQTVNVDETDAAPKEFALHQNYPNPFNPTTTISFSVPVGPIRESPVRLVVYDLLGREVATLVNEVKQPGMYEVVWDASNQASGVFFYRLSAGGFTQTRKAMLVR